MNEIKVADFKGRGIRSQVSADGDIWFVSKDVMEVLGIKYQAHALRKLNDSERSSISLQGETGKRDFSAVKESGLYKLIMMSSKKEAVEFQDWITTEVLPSIRKTGSYSLVQQQPIDDLDRMEMWVREQRENRRKMLQISTTLSETTEQISFIQEESKRDTLTSDQKRELTDMINAKGKQIDPKDYRILSVMKRDLKERFLGKGYGSTLTYKDIPRESFEDACKYIKSFKYIK